MKNKRATINLKNNYDRYFQYAITVVLNYQNIKNNPERLTKIKPFIDQKEFQEFQELERNEELLCLNCLHKYSAED